jgi:hypothetical protein
MDCDAAERRRGDEEERGEERGFARRRARAWAAAVGFGLLGAVALVFTVSGDWEGLGVCGGGDGVQWRASN